MKRIETYSLFHEITEELISMLRGLSAGITNSRSTKQLLEQQAET